MSAVKPRSGDVTQHAGETTATPEVRLLLLLLLLLHLRTRTALPLAASLRMDDGRQRHDQNRDPCRNYGEDRFPHSHSPKTLRHPLH